MVEKELVNDVSSLLDKSIAHIITVKTETALSKKNLKHLKDKINKFFNNMINTMDEDGFSFDKFPVDTMIEKFVLNDGKNYQCYWFPNVLKDIIVDMLKELAYEKGYFIKCYYSPIQFDYIEFGKKTMVDRLQQIYVSIYTKEKFNNDFEKSINDLINEYDKYILQNEMEYDQKNINIIQKNIYIRLITILEFYEEIGFNREKIIKDFDTCISEKKEKSLIKSRRIL